MFQPKMEIEAWAAVQSVAHVFGPCRDCTHAWKPDDTQFTFCLEVFFRFSYTVQSFCLFHCIGLPALFGKRSNTDQFLETRVCGEEEGRGFRDGEKKRARVLDGGACVS